VGGWTKPIVRYCKQRNITAVILILRLINLSIFIVNFIVVRIVDGARGDAVG